MKLKKLFIILAVLVSVSKLSAQSAEVVTSILNSEKVTFGQVCYLVAVHEGFIKESASYAEAISALDSKHMIPYAVYEETYVPLANLSYLYAQIFDVKGGLMFKLFRGAPRYAYKQLKYDGVLPANSFPNKIVSGQEALDIYTACMMEYTDYTLSVD